MGVLFFFAILIILAIYGSINYYIGLKGWELISSLLPFVSSKIYWPIFWLIALSYIIVRFLSRFMPSAISYFLTLIGSYWLGAMIYLSMIILIIRIITFLDRLLSFIPAQLKTTSVSNIISICVILIVAALLVSGVRSANNPTTVKYDVTINKDAGTIKTLHAIAVSDIHLGTLVRKNH
ncbi:MAG: metallophosphoesterase, partial [Bacillota bacterium]|nr:metallophosphoesterase [Bacillota bacterium]